MDRRSMLRAIGAAEAAKIVKGGKEQKKNWLVRPVLGPLPGGAVLGIGAALLAGLGFAVKAIFFRRR